MTDSLRIAHCSDIHLGTSAPKDRPLEEFECRAFAAALEDIGAQRPDLMLLAGDLFDTNRAGVETIQWAMETLSRQPFPIVMIPGNHDCMADDGIYRRHEFHRIPNVRLLAAEAGEITFLPELGVAAWGKGMVDHSPAYSPLFGCPDRPADCRWFLGLGHGHLVAHGAHTDRSSPIHMREIEDSAFDYLALGHLHAAAEIATDKVAAAYSGSPTDQTGGGATYIIVDLASGAAPAVCVQVVSVSNGLLHAR